MIGIDMRIRNFSHWDEEGTEENIRISSGRPQQRKKLHRQCML